MAYAGVYIPFGELVGVADFRSVSFPTSYNWNSWAPSGHGIYTADPTGTSWFAIVGMVALLSAINIQVRFELSPVHSVSLPLMVKVLL